MALTRNTKRTILAGVGLVVGGFVIALLIWIVYLDRIVTAQFEGRRWTLPAQVYAEPLELYAGQAFGALMVLLIAIGEDQVTAFSAIAACMNNTGTGLGEVARNFATLSDPGKWICLLAMLLGCLEVFPLLVLVSPTFWRR